MPDTDHWETHRGDEWWYADSFVEANAGFNQAPPALVIDGLRSRGQGLNADRLYSFLWRSHLQFPDAQIRLVLAASTRPIIDALVASGRIRVELVKNPYSVEARILVFSASTA